MRATLSICSSAPVDPEGRYRVLRQFAAAVPTYGNAFLIFGQPSWPLPPNIVLVLRDGTADWAWDSLLASHPVLEKFILHCHWSEAGQSFVVGTKAAFVARGVLATLLLDNVAPHMWQGDSP